MRLLALGLASAEALRAGVTPTQKVIQLLQDMTAKGEREKHDETVQFATYKQWCEGTAADKQGQIKANNDRIASLNASIAKNAADAKRLGQQVAAHDQDINLWEGDKVTSQRIRDNERKDFEALDADLTESVSAISMAREVLQKQNYRRKQAEQGDSAKRSTEDVGIALSQVASGPFIDAESRRIIDAFLMKGDDDEAHRAVQNPEAHGYSFQSQGVIDLLDKLSEKFDKQRNDMRDQERQNKEAFQLLTQKLNAEIQEATRQRSVKSEARAAKLEKKGKQEGELADETETRDDNKEFLSEMVSTCEKKADEFEQRQQLRADEHAAVSKAIEILSSKSVSGNAEKHFPQDHESFAQALLQLSASYKFLAQKPHVVAYLMQQGQKLNSAALTALAVRAEGDPLRKVKQMIKKLIVQLMEEATDEAEHQGWCNTELTENEHVRNEKTEKVELLSATIDNMKTSVAKLKEDIKNLEASNSGLHNAVAQATAERQKEKAINAVTVADAKEGQSAVAQAIQVLQEFYAKAAEATALLQKDTPQPKAPEIFDSPYKGQQGENTGVIGLLEVIQSDFARLESDTLNNEESASKAHTKFLDETELLLAQQLKDIEHKTANMEDQSKLLQDSEKDIIGTNKERDAAFAYYDVLKKKCISSGTNFADRAAGRQEEIESLQEALRILKSEDLQ